MLNYTASNKRQIVEIEETDVKIWKRPVIREIRCGMEINLYVTAEL
jgi:coenzyme PQQ precursor peptide PqqA